jgi:DNA-binding XRE family transcriptional regulator
MEESRGAAEVPEAGGVPGLPLLPGFREMALRRMSAERRRLVADLTAQRRSAGLSQTEVAARMGTSQSAVARLESGDADVRVSTLERYAAAIGSQLAWQARAQPGADQHPVGPDPKTPGPVGPDPVGPGPRTPGPVGPDPVGPGPARPGFPQAGQPQAGQGQEYR